MGQGIYRIVGFGVVNAPAIDWDSNDDIHGLVHTAYECEQTFVIIPFGVDQDWLQRSWTIGPLPKGLPHIDDRTAVAVKQTHWWPDVGKDGIWVADRIVRMWEVIRLLAKEKGIDLPVGEPVFASDFH